MALRRDVDVRGNDRRPERDNMPRQDRTMESAVRAPRPALNEYFIEGEGISREVLQTEICKYLGAQATSRPGDYNGHRGFFVRAVRPFTPDMLEDLRTASRDYQREAHKARSRGFEDLSYTESETRRNVDSRIFASGGDTHSYQPGYPPVGSTPYTMAGPPNAYPPPSSAFPPVPGYQTGGIQYSSAGSVPAIPGQTVGGRAGFQHYAYDNGGDPGFAHEYPPYSARPGYDAPAPAPRESGIPASYGYSGPPDNERRGVYDDRQPRGGYYESGPPGPAGMGNFPQQPYRGQSYEPSTGRETYGRQGAAPEAYSGQRRR